MPRRKSSYRDSGRALVGEECKATVTVAGLVGDGHIEITATAKKC